MTDSSGIEVIYFAYGSNMSSAQMQNRCPTSITIGTACLEGTGLVFPRLSKRRKCAVAGIEESTGAEVWGVLWQMSAQDRTALDRSEDYRQERQNYMNSYNPIDIAVICGDGAPVSRFTYEAVRQKDFSGKPSRDYLAAIIKGAREHRLPTHYIVRLEQIGCQD